MSRSLYIGIMSGTSMDGIDAVLAELSGPAPRILEANSLPLPDSLCQGLLALQTPYAGELRDAQLLSQALGQRYAQVCAPWTQSKWAKQIRAIGVHGQTVRHEPEAGYTLQLNAPALVAELTGIDVIADFRSRDIAAGGQGAPLVPIVHQALFSDPQQKRVVLNLGGIANISILHPGKPVLGFDTGPANMLMDAWIQQHKHTRYDSDGLWAASAQADPELLQSLLSEPWFTQAPPKSTGRDLFNLDWLQRHLQGITRPLTPAQIQASLLELSAQSVSQAILEHAPGTEEILVCGGGAHNPLLLNRIAAHSLCKVRSTAELGLPPQQIEALAFAWLAYAHIENIPAGLPSVTGARHARLLGACYPA